MNILICEQSLDSIRASHWVIYQYFCFCPLISTDAATGSQPASDNTQDGKMRFIEIKLILLCSMIGFVSMNLMISTV